MAPPWRMCLFLCSLTTTFLCLLFWILTCSSGFLTYSIYSIKYEAESLEWVPEEHQVLCLRCREQQINYFIEKTRLWLPFFNIRKSTSARRWAVSVQVRKTKTSLKNSSGRKKREKSNVQSLQVYKEMLDRNPQL